MTREETIKVLAVLKSNYSDQLKTLQAADAEGMINGWQAQFGLIPYSVMIIAINRYSSKSRFFPKFCDIFEELRQLKSEAETMMYYHKLATIGVIGFQGEVKKIGTQLDDYTLAQVNLILNACSPKNTEAKPLAELISDSKRFLELNE